MGGHCVSVTEFSSAAIGTHEIGEVFVGGRVPATVKGRGFSRHPVTLTGACTATEETNHIKRRCDKIIE